MKSSGEPSVRVQAKVCGLTRPDEAEACAALGADAIGLVFYAKSPRNVTLSEACSIAAAVPLETRLVGVFVNPEYDDLMRKAQQCGLWGVQLHGQEPRELVSRIAVSGIHVIKTLFGRGEPALDAASSYQPSAFLVESGGGLLPGGNALAWDWSGARRVSDRFPTILAGGLSEKNVALAAAGSRADAVDVSSGVETRPGRKDLRRVEAFLKAVRQMAPGYAPRRIF
ncbi:MAG: phosphoribosylanthranilate isomerase [Desulfobacterales bacterium]